jgi:glutaminyl-tRNA synthetase
VHPACHAAQVLPQLEGAFQYLASIGEQPVDTAALEARTQPDLSRCRVHSVSDAAAPVPAAQAASGVGVVVTAEQLRAAVSAAVSADEAKIRATRYHTNPGPLLAKVRAAQPWSDAKAAKAELEAQMAALLGPRTAEDDKPPEKPKKEKAAPPAPVAAAVAAAAAAAPEEASGETFSFLADPRDNCGAHTVITFSDGRVWRPANTRAELDAHLAATGGRVITRFPPEPNGYLHIGHAKAMNVDFGAADKLGGACYLRYDDTNPEAEKMEYITHIEDIVSWMGWKPAVITYASDYFQQLYDLAVELIRRGHAYVCHQSAEEIRASREARRDSPWRDRPRAESERIFEDMRRGLWAEGSATLRMRQDPRNDNFNMFDLIAYRIKYAPHPHAGDKWCVYPSYDYTHCINDALENVTHSLCTLEFETRRASYYWLLQALDLYKPVVWEYSRLNITHNVLSKRKLNKLCTGGFVRGWDDPRLLTLAGLRRRGAPAEAINNFVRAVGVSRNENMIPLALLDFHIRDVLNRGARRAMAVLHPLRVVLTNVPEGTRGSVKALAYPQRPAGEGSAGEAETYEAPFGRVVYIEHSDFRAADAKGYYGLAPGKRVLLRYASVIVCREAVFAADGVTPTELRCEVEPAAPGTKPPKGVIHWVGEPAPGVAPPRLEARLYDHLFRSEDPNAITGDWLADMNPESEVVVRGGFAGPGIADAPVGQAFQLERLGYFALDPDSKPGALVLNRTVSLRDGFKE